MPPALLAMLPALLKTGLGAAQGVTGIIGMQGLRRPRYNIPGAAVEALGTARELAGRMEMPGESAARAQISQQAANAYGQAQQYGMAGLASLPAIMAGQQGAELNLAAQAAGWRTQQQQNLINELGQFAQYQDQAWQMNEFAPYRDKLQRMQNLIGAGAQNFVGGMDTAMMTMIGLPDSFGGGVSKSNSGSTAMQSTTAVAPSRVAMPATLGLPGMGGITSPNMGLQGLPGGYRMPGTGQIFYMPPPGSTGSSKIAAAGSQAMPGQGGTNWANMPLHQMVAKLIGTLFNIQ